MKHRIPGPWSPAALVRIFLIAALVLVLVAETLSGALPRALCPWIALASTSRIERTFESDAPLHLPTPFGIPQGIGDSRSHIGARSS